MLYLSKWLGNNKHKFFKNLNDKIAIVDIGWKRTIYLLFELISLNTVNLILNNNETITIRISNNKDYIFIGCISSEKNYTQLIPFLGKVYENSDDYQKTIKEIRNRVELVNFFGENKFVTFAKDISVYVEEKESTIYIELIFKDYMITGLTNKKEKGYYEFIKNYKKEEFIISGIECVKLKKMD